MRERKFKKIRKLRKIFLVVCEGETEEKYIELLKRHYRVPVTIKTKVSGNRISFRLIRQYLEELGLEKGDNYEIFYVYDADVQSVVDKLRTLPGRLLLSNPCIELWYLLHNISVTRSLTADGVIKELSRVSQVWRYYRKGALSPEQATNLTSASGSAVAKAKALPWPSNPSTNLFEFIEALTN